MLLLTSLITLVTSKGTPTPGEVAPATLSSLKSLLLTVQIYRAMPYLPPSYIGCLGPSPQLTSPEKKYCLLSQIQLPNMYTWPSTPALATLPCGNHGVHRISLTLAATSDHKSWTSRLYCDILHQSQARPRHQAVPLIGILRALWDHQAADTDSRLTLNIPDFSLLQSLRA